VLLTFGPLFFWALEKEGPKGSPVFSCGASLVGLASLAQRNSRPLVFPSPAASFARRATRLKDQTMKGKKEKQLFPQRLLSLVHLVLLCPPIQRNIYWRTGREKERPSRSQSQGNTIQPVRTKIG